jgi:hypothetical protein
MVSFLLALPALGFWIAVRLSPKIAKRHSARVYAISACCGVLYSACVIACLMMGFDLGYVVWLLFPFLVGRVGLWIARRCGVLQPQGAGGGG